MGILSKILLTGSNGFVGSHVFKALLKHGFRPVLILRTTSNLWRIAELLNSSDCPIYFSDKIDFNIEEIYANHEIDGVIHLATEYGRNATLADIVETNVVYPLRLLEAGKEQLKVFINTDTFFAKSQFAQVYLKDYTASKRTLENFLKTYKSSVKIVNVRLEHVFGEEDAEGKFFTSILKDLLSNKETIALTSGNQRRDFVYVEDVVNAYILILNRFEVLTEYQEFEVGTGNSIALKDFITVMANLAFSSSKLDFGALASREGDIEDSKAKNANLLDLGWKAAYTVEDALKLIIKREKLIYGKRI